MDPQCRVDPSVNRGRPLTNPAISSQALLTALAAPATPATPVVSPSARRGAAAAISPPAHLEKPEPFSVEWQLPLPTRDLIVEEDNRDVVVDVRDMTRGAGADLELFGDASHSAWGRGGRLTSGGLADTKRG